MTCMKCERYLGIHTPCMEAHVPDDGADVLIVLEAPTYAEDICGTMLGNTTGKWLLRRLKENGLDVKKCAYTYAMKCYCVEDKPRAADIKACKENLLEDIARIKPKYIVTVGALALKVLTGKSLEKSYGKALYMGDAIIVPTYAAEDLVKRPSLAWLFDEDIKHVVRMTTSPKIPDVKMHIPSAERWSRTYKYFDVEVNNICRMIEDIPADAAVSYDIETSGLAMHENGAEIYMLGLSWKEYKPSPYPHGKKPVEVIHAFIIPGVYIDHPEVTKRLKALLEDKKRMSIAQNAKFDNRWLRRYFGLSPYVNFDTYLAGYLYHNSMPHNLKWMARVFCHAHDYDRDIEFKVGLPIDDLVRMAVYCAWDVVYTLLLKDVLLERMKEAGVYKVFKHIVMPGERVLQTIETNGVHINQEKLAEVREEYIKLREEASAKITAALPKKWLARGIELNVNSPTQLAKLLFEDLKLPKLKKTPSGGESTGKSVLLRLADHHELPALILEFRKYEKAVNGFLDAWQPFLERDGRLHSTYNIAKTATGRLSAEEPNLQQCPRDKNVRSLVSAPPGRRFIEADYSQIELRVAAFIAGEQNMKALYRAGVDIHGRTGSRVSGVALELLTKAMRTAAKAVNFGFLFGMGAPSFKDYAFDSYGVIFTEAEAVRARALFFEDFPGLVKWHERQRNEARQFKCVKTATGRIRHLLDIDSPEYKFRGDAERQAINTPVQSLASDMTMIALILIQKALDKYYPGKALLVGQIHDAILVEADNDVAVEVALLVKECMEYVPEVLKKYFGVYLDVPIVSEVEMGDGWSVGKPVEKIS